MGCIVWRIIGDREQSLIEASDARANAAAEYNADAVTDADTHQRQDLLDKKSICRAIC